MGFSIVEEASAFFIGLEIASIALRDSSPNNARRILLLGAVAVGCSELVNGVRGMSKGIKKLRQLSLPPSPHSQLPPPFRAQSFPAHPAFPLPLLQARKSLQISTMSYNQAPIAFFGATGGCALACLVRTLNAGIDSRARALRYQLPFNDNSRF